MPPIYIVQRRYKLAHESNLLCLFGRFVWKNYQRIMNLEERNRGHRVLNLFF